MKTSKLFFTAAICLMALSAISCSNSNKANKSAASTDRMAAPDNSRTSVDWASTYMGVLPCADCEGIQTSIVLNEDLSYQIRYMYLGKDNSQLTESGSFTWNDEGNEITLSDANSNAGPAKYIVGENKLIQLDMEGRRMEAASENLYTLVKVSDIVEKYWKLIELNGSAVAVAENQRREPHLILRVDNYRVSGNGGCNSFSGMYTIENGNRISFSKMVSTMMACPDMQIESRLIKVLETADNYTINGDTLSLNRARMAPLARFAAVYL